MTNQLRSGARKRVFGRRPQAAYTFAEVLVAILIVGIMAICLLACFFSGFAILQSSRENLRATQIMLQRIEAIRLFTWKQVLDTTNYLKPTFLDYYDPLGSTSNAQGAPYSGFVTSSIPTDLPDAYRTNVRTISLTLYWTNYSGNQATVRSRQMETRFARNGMQNYLWGAQ